MPKWTHTRWGANKPTAISWKPCRPAHDQVFLTKMFAPEETTQTSHCRSCKYNTSPSTVGVDPALGQEWHRKILRVSQPCFQGTGQLKTTQWLPSKISSFSALLRFVWLKTNPSKILLDERGRWAQCTGSAGESGGLHSEPWGRSSPGQHQQPPSQASSSACNFQCWQGQGAGQPCVGCCSLIQELSNRWGRSVIITAQ